MVEHKNILVEASTFNCRIAGICFLFRVLQHIFIDCVIVSHPQTGSLEKAAEDKEVRLSVSVIAIKASLMRGHHCVSHHLVIIGVPKKYL